MPAEEIVAVTVVVENVEADAVVIVEAAVVVANAEAAVAANAAAAAVLVVVVVAIAAAADVAVIAAVAADAEQAVEVEKNNQGNQQIGLYYVPENLYLCSPFGKTSNIQLKQALKSTYNAPAKTT